jgi:hypothetical protein
MVAGKFPFDDLSIQSSLKTICSSPKLPEQFPHELQNLLTQVFHNNLVFTSKIEQIDFRY